MKKIFFMLLCFFGILLACDSQVHSDVTKQKSSNNFENKKVLTIFYSYSGNTKQIAQQIQKIVGGDIAEIKTIKPYSQDYNTVVKQAKQEKADNFKPEIKVDIKNIKDYDVIFIGTPVWWYTMASPLRTFLSKNNFSNKTIVPFCTHGGGGKSSTFIDIQKMQPNAKILEGLAIYENGDKNTKQDIQDWIYNLNIK